MLVRLLVLCCAAIFIPLAQAQEPAVPTEPAEPVASSDLFEKGLRNYQSKQYREALDSFQELWQRAQTETELAQVPILHNLALAAVQLEQTPLAIAAWRKALSLEPGFQPATLGREFLEQKFALRPFERDPLALWLRRALEKIGLHPLLWLLAVLLGTAGWTAISYLSERRIALDTEQPLPSVPLLSIALWCVFVFNLAVIGLKLRDQATTRATILAAKVSVRSLPANDGVSLLELTGGNEVLVRREEPGWLQVQTAEGSSGWIQASEAMITSQR